MTDDYRFESMTREAAAAVVGWRYEEPYSFYDMERDPGDLAEFLDPTNWPDAYFAVYQGCELVGFVSFDDADGTVTVGLGMKPERTGQGEGRGFLRACLDFATARYGPDEFALSVAAFNERAITVYERAGFERTGTALVATNGGEYEFVEMRLALGGR